MMWPAFSSFYRRYKDIQNMHLVKKKKAEHFVEQRKRLKAHELNGNYGNIII